MLNITQAVTQSVRGTFNYAGRARRSEYWWTWFFILVLVVALGYVDDWIIPVVSDADMQDYNGGGWKEWLLDWKYTPFSTGLYYLALPTLIAVTGRRMHDVGRPAWIGIVPMLAMELEIFFPIMDLSNNLGAELFISSSKLAVSLGLRLVVIVLGLYSFFLSLGNSERLPNRYGQSPKYFNEVDTID